MSAMTERSETPITPNVTTDTLRVIFEEWGQRCQRDAERLETLMFDQLLGTVYTRVLELMLHRLHRPYPALVEEERDNLAEAVRIHEVTLKVLGQRCEKLQALVREVYTDPVLTMQTWPEWIARAHALLGEEQK